jgi:hypothetical protein
MLLAIGKNPLQTELRRRSARFAESLLGPGRYPLRDPGKLSGVFFACVQRLRGASRDYGCGMRSSVER